MKFQITGIPTVLTIRDGEVVGRVVGTRNEASYRSLFDALTAGREIRVPIAPFDRMLRLGAGALVIIVGFSTGSWLVAGIGGLIAFFGVYDRCPIWRAVTTFISSK